MDKLKQENVLLEMEECKLEIRKFLIENGKRSNWK